MRTQQTAGNQVEQVWIGANVLKVESVDWASQLVACLLEPPRKARSLAGGTLIVHVTRSGLRCIRGKVDKSELQNPLACGKASSRLKEIFFGQGQLQIGRGNQSVSGVTRSTTELLFPPLIECNYSLGNVSAKICHGFTEGGDGTVSGFLLCRSRQA